MLHPHPHSSTPAGSRKPLFPEGASWTACCSVIPSQSGMIKKNIVHICGGREGGGGVVWTHVDLVNQNVFFLSSLREGSKKISKCGL